jgi:hypothetical protein
MVKVSKRGIAWMGAGVVVYVVGLLMGQQFVLRGTRVPFWPLVMGIGAIILVIDLIRGRGAKKSEEEPPTPAP